VNVVLTGASGFLGRHLVERLYSAGAAGTNGGTSAVALTCVARHAPLGGDSGVRWVEADVCTPGALDSAFDGADVLVHAAGKVSHDPNDNDAVWRVHMVGTELALAAAKKAGIKRVVYLSTSGTIAVREDLGEPSDALCSDERAPSPLGIVQAWPYYRSKLFAEELALAAQSPGFDVVSLNPSLLLGPGDDPAGQSTASVRMFFEGSVPPPPPGGLSFVDVRDTADAVFAALTRGQGGKRYLLGGANWTFRRYFETIARMTRTTVPSMGLPNATRKFLSWMPGLKLEDLPIKVPISRHELELACHTWYVDDRLARRELGWAPRDPLDTVYDTVRDIQARGSRFPRWERS
jgi:dihydroflavonol-4-reductase